MGESVQILWIKTRERTPPRQSEGGCPPLWTKQRWVWVSLVESTVSAHIKGPKPRGISSFAERPPPPCPSHAAHSPGLSHLILWWQWRPPHTRIAQLTPSLYAWHSNLSDPESPFLRNSICSTNLSPALYFSFPIPPLTSRPHSTFPSATIKSQHQSQRTLVLQVGKNQRVLRSKGFLQFSNVNPGSVPMPSLKTKPSRSWVDHGWAEQHELFHCHMIN